MKQMQTFGLQLDNLQATAHVNNNLLKYFAWNNEYKSCLWDSISQFDRNFKRLWKQHSSAARGERRWFPVGGKFKFELLQ